MNRFFSNNDNAPILFQLLKDNGPFWIKTGQWLSQRPDILPKSFCDLLKKLQSDAPTHSLQDSLSEISCDVQKKLFLKISPIPLASGSIAQVHHATFQKNGIVENCIVKIRHPFIKSQLEADVRMMQWIFTMGAFFGNDFCSSIDISQVMEQMLTQIDLRSEVKHMKLLRESFRHEHSFLTNFPEPIYEEYHTESFIMETFVPGVFYSQLKTKEEKDLCKRLTMASFIQMILVHGIVHGDCHSGNILYHVSPKPESYKEKLPTKCTTTTEAPDFYQASMELEHFSVQARVGFVDFGMVIVLQPQQREHLLQLITGCYSKNASLCVSTMKSLVNMVDSRHCCLREEKFKKFELDYVKLIEHLDSDENEKASVGDMLRETLSMLQKHKLRIDGDIVRIFINYILIEEDYPHVKYNNLFDNAMRYVMYNDEEGHFDSLVPKISTWASSHYELRFEKRTRTLLPVYEKYNESDLLLNEHVDSLDFLVLENVTKPTFLSSASSSSSSSSSRRRIIL